MIWVIQITLAGLLAGVFTFSDLEAVFSPPPHGLDSSRWAKFNCWWWGFILINTVLAIVLFCVLNHLEYTKEWDDWLTALLVGFAYPALVRSKITTFQINGQNMPLGPELLYEAFKGMVHRRINQIIRQWRMERIAELVESNLAELRNRALMMVDTDALMADADRNSTRNWIESVANDGETAEDDKRRVLATYIITEQVPN